MSSIQDIRPGLLIARAFGLAPYSINAESASVSRLPLIYTFLWMLFYFYALYNRLDIYFHGDVDLKSRVLSIARTILSVCTLTADAAVCATRNDKFQTALLYLRKYDLAVKYDVKKRATMLAVHTWTVFSFMIIFFLAIGWFTYFYEAYESLMAAIIYVYLYLPLSIAVMKFITLVTSIFLRFRHLTRMLFPDLLSVILEVDGDYKRLHLRDICWLHSCLFAAAENVNSLYSMQLLLWFANFTLNTITRIDDFLESEKPPTTKFIRDGGLVIMFVLLVSLMAGICHLTSSEANKVGSIVFLPSSRFFRICIEQDREDKFAAGQYFALHPLQFSAGFGLFEINQPLLLKIAGAMTTYLVILKSPTKC